MLWNAYGVYLLLDSRQYISQARSDELESQSNEDTSSLSKVALPVFGKYGSNTIDFLMILLMVGIIVAYEGKIN